MLYRTHNPPAGISTKAFPMLGYGYEVRNPNSQNLSGRVYKKAHPKDHNLGKCIFIYLQYLLKA